MTREEKEELLFLRLTGFYPRHTADQDLLNRREDAIKRMCQMLHTRDLDRMIDLSA